ncbi:MAG: diguanylate cyclase [Pseudomonadota bacterium]
MNPTTAQDRAVDQQLTTRIALAFPAARADFQRAVSVLILAVASVAVIVLLGWTFHIEPMKRIVTGLTSMNPVTAVCFLVSGFVLWQLRQQRPGGRRALLVNLLPLFVLYVGVTKLLDLWMGTALCPDALLFTSQLNFGQVYPSRMAPNVAVSFVLLAIALLVVDRPRWPAYLHPQWLATPILLAALTALVGYAYDTSGFYKYKQYIPMALHTAVCFVMICLALILSRPDQAYLRLIPRHSPGARSYARLLPACVLVPALLGGVALFGTDSGWFEGRGTGTSIATVLTILAFSVLAFINAASINRAEGVRRLSEIQLRTLVMELDSRNKALQVEISERKRMEEKAAHLATHDPLTGLPNRLLFLDRLQTAVGRTVRSGNACALFYIDIDNFKPVNDEHGHQAGDELLKELSFRLRSTMRDVDTVARLGGDEFAAIMDAPISTEHALGLAHRLSEAVSRPYRLSVQGHPLNIEVRVGISVGIALFPGHASDLDSLVRVADSAMYLAKRDGKRKGSSTNIGVATI